MSARLAPCLGQLSEHVEVGQGEPRRLREIDLEPAHERGVRLEERAPGLEPVPVRQGLGHEPIEETGNLGLGIYLRTQPPGT